MNWRKWLRILHRDFGYFIVGIVLIYSVSGIVLNHRTDFNPNFQIIVSEVSIDLPAGPTFSEEEVKKAVEAIDEQVRYKKSYINKEGLLKVFIENGEVVVDPATGKGSMEYLKKRPLLYQMNYLHKASTISAWKWVSDSMAVLLIFVTVSGIFLLKGKNGFMRRGIWFLVAGLVTPVVFMIFFI